MKQYFILAIIFFTITTAVNAQNSFKPESSIGIKLGGNISRVAFDLPIEQNLNYGYLGGIVFKHKSERKLGIQLELNYMQAGWNEKLDTINTYIRRLNYIQVPIMTHINIGEGKTNLIFNLGTYVSFLISESDEINFIVEEEVLKYYNEPLSNNTEFGFTGGLGIVRKTSIGTFQIEARFNQSLNNIFKYEVNSQEYPFSASKNQTLEVTLSYLLNLKSRKK
ncbi:MAG: porin family protein [Bacteroidota bacterium]